MTFETYDVFKLVTMSIFLELPFAFESDVTIFTEISSNIFFSLDVRPKTNLLLFSHNPSLRLSTHSEKLVVKSCEWSVKYKSQRRKKGKFSWDAFFKLISVQDFFSFSSYLTKRKQKLFFSGGMCNMLRILDTNSSFFFRHLFKKFSLKNMSQYYEYSNFA